jgi:hypothetical protein
VFWAENNALKSANLDGTNVVTLATPAVPTGVGFDEASGLLYFSDNSADTISTINTDGSGETVIYTSSDVYDNPRHVTVQ